MTRPLLSVLMALLVAIPGCGRSRELPPGMTSFTPSRVAVEGALEADRVDQAVEHARRFERRFPGPVPNGLLGEALWRSGRLNEAEGYLRRAAQAGDRRGALGMARVAISRSRWERAREWIEAADGDGAVGPLSLAIALAIGDAETAREAAETISEASSGGGGRLQRLAAAVVDGGFPTGWRGEPAAVPIHESPAGWLVEARFADRPVRLRLALDESRSWIRREAAGADGAAGAPSSAAVDAAAGSGVVVGDLTLGSLRRQRVILEVRPPPGDDGPRPAAAVDGEIAADLLADLRWSLDARARRFVAAPADGDGWDAAAGAAPAVREKLGLPAGEGVHWLSVRVLREGLDVQWLLMPRLEAQVMAAVIAGRRGSLVDDDALADLGVTAEGADSGATLQARLGAWWPSVRLEVADLSSRAAGGRVAPRLALGPELFRDWRLLWDPGSRQLGLVPEAPGAGELE